LLLVLVDKIFSGKDKLILVDGSVLKALNLFKKLVYFDQAWHLTTHFAIHHVPAILRQHGELLKISEVLL